MSMQSYESVVRALLAVGCHKLEVVSDTNQLDAFFGHLTFQVFPVVAAFLVVLFIVDGAYDICGGVLRLASLMS